MSALDYTKTNAYICTFTKEYNLQLYFSYDNGQGHKLQTTEKVNDGHKQLFRSLDQPINLVAKNGFLDFEIAVEVIDSRAWS
jgi:hypothetical protein